MKTTGRVTHKEGQSVCVLGELLGGGWRVVKGHIVDVKASQHQRADSGCEGSLQHSLSTSLSTHTLFHSAP